MTLKMWATLYGGVIFGDYDTSTDTQRLSHGAKMKATVEFFIQAQVRQHLNAVI